MLQTIASERETGTAVDTFNRRLATANVSETTNQMSPATEHLAGLGRQIPSPGCPLYCSPIIVVVALYNANREFCKCSRMPALTGALSGRSRLHQGPHICPESILGIPLHAEIRGSVICICVLCSTWATGSCRLSMRKGPSSSCSRSGI